MGAGGAGQRFSPRRVDYAVDKNREIFGSPMLVRVYVDCLLTEQVALYGLLLETGRYP